MASLTLLGTGTSSGVPVIGCRCKVCHSSNSNDKRTRSSILIEGDNKESLLFDASTDLRTQALTNKIEKIDALFLTHHHADHVHGIDDLRSFNYLQKKAIKCYGREDTLRFIQTMFPYIFSETPPEGGGVPSLDLIPLTGPVNIGSLTVIPVPIRHGSMIINAYRINDAAYVTDCSGISDDSLKLLENLDTLILGALGLKSHPTHFTISEAIEAIKIIKPKQALLTHLDHTIGHDVTEAKLPSHIKLAYDGLRLEI